MPNPNNSVLDRALKQAEWRGYTLKALEDMNGELKEIKLAQKELDIKIEALNDRLTNVQIKMASVAATLALIVSIVMKFVLA